MIISIKKVFLFSAITLILGVSSIYGILTLTRVESSQPITSTATFYPLELKLELAKTEFQMCEPIVMNISLTNLSNETVRIIFAHEAYHLEWFDSSVFDLYQLDFEVFDSNGTKVYPGIGSSLEGAAEEEVYLGPHAQASLIASWDQYLWDLYDEPVPRGTYTIVAKTASSFSLGSNYTGPNMLQTPPITITIAAVESLQLITSAVTSFPLELKLGLAKTEFQIGEAILLNVSLTNLSNETLTIVFVDRKWMTTGVLSELDFEVFDSNGTKVYDDVFGGLGAFETIYLEPHSEVSRIGFWNQTNDVVYPYDAPVPRGTYTIVARTASGFISVKPDYTGPEMLQTPPITITIS